MAMFFNKQLMPQMPSDLAAYSAIPLPDQQAINTYAAMPVAPQEAPQQHKGGGLGNVLKGILGGALDGVASYYGADPGFATNRKRQQELLEKVQELQYKAQVEDAQRQRARADSNTDWQSHYDYEAGHPKPTDLEQKIAMLRKQPGFENITLPQAMDILNPTISQGPQGQTFTPRAAMGMGGGAAIPPAAIADLKQNPRLANDFDAAYGQGAAQRYLGGGGSNVTGGFPNGPGF